MAAAAATKTIHGAAASRRRRKPPGPGAAHRSRIGSTRHRHANPGARACRCDVTRTLFPRPCNARVDMVRGLRTSARWTRIEHGSGRCTRRRASGRLQADGERRDTGQRFVCRRGKRHRDDRPGGMTPSDFGVPPCGNAHSSNTRPARVLRSHGLDRQELVLAQSGRNQRGLGIRTREHDDDGRAQLRGRPRELQRRAQGRRQSSPPSSPATRRPGSATAPAGRRRPRRASRPRRDMISPIPAAAASRGHAHRPAARAAVPTRPSQLRTTR